MANLIYRTTDAAPIPEQTAVKNSPLTNSEVDGNFRSIKEDLDSKAPTNNAGLTGIPTAPTAPFGTDTTQIATTEFVRDAVDAIVVPVTSVAGRTGNVTLTKSDVGLSNANNTSDATKNVLSATKLTTARTIELTGDAVGSAGFDGTGNVSITVAVQDNSHAHTVANITGLQAEIDKKDFVITTTAVDKTLANRERCFVTAATKTITLPASPVAGWEVAIGVGAFEDTVIVRNGKNIMGLAENLTINKQNVVVSLTFVDNTIGWRVI